MWEGSLETAPVQHRRASFSSYYPERSNGWGPHRLVFNGSIEEIISSSKTQHGDIFMYDELNGNIEVLKSGYLLKIEFWWKGRAPWGYHFVYIIRNLPVCPETLKMTMPPGAECSLPAAECRAVHSSPHDVGEVCCSSGGYWYSPNGHVVCVLPTMPGDKFSIINLPAHIQGTPGIFELRVSAYQPSPKLELNASISQAHTLLDLIRNNSAPEVVQDFLRRSHFSISNKNDEIGMTAIELLLSKESTYYSEKPEEFLKMKDLLCINSYSHSPWDPEVYSSPNATLCWQCKAPVQAVREDIENSEKFRVLNEDESLFGVGIQSNPPNEAFEKASLAALERGVDVRWLERFTDFHDCWAWPTWRVVSNIIKPATAHSRVRYIHLPGVATAANIGKVDIFLSHAWGGIWGDLVAAALSCVQTDDGDDPRPVVRVYIDVFAVRQWPGNINDIVFEGVVRHARLVLVVVSARELVNIGNLNFKDITEKRLSILSAAERRAIPFLRIWCLAEINSACVQNKPLVIACGSYSLDTRTKTVHVFESNAPLLYHIQFLVNVEEAKALMKEDEERILRQVREGVGYDAVNRQVRGAIVGALVSSRCATVRLASVGNPSSLIKLLEECFRKKSIESSSELLVKVHEALCAAVASGFREIFDLILGYSEGSDVPLMSMKDSDGMTALMHAVRGGHRSLVEVIINMCTAEDIDVLNNDSWTALAFAAQGGCEETLRMLLVKTSNVNQSLSGGQTALGIGLQNNFSLTCCRLLLEAGSNVHHRDGVGYTLLRHAIIPGQNPELVNAILNMHADPNAIDNWGDSILGTGLDAINIESIKALIDFDPSFSWSTDDSDAPRFSRADVNLINIHTGLNPLDRAINSGKAEIVKLLQSYGAVTVQEIMKNKGALGCGRLTESSVVTIMSKFNVDREHAGLMLSVKAGRLDWVLDATSFPKPFDIVSTDVIRQPGNKWGYGIVTRGKDWDYDDNVDGGPGSIGYIQAVNQNDTKEKKIRVKWMLSNRKDEGFVFTHRAGSDGKFDLLYAPYK